MAVSLAPNVVRRIYALTLAGKSDSSIARELGVSDAVVGNYRRRRLLPDNNDRKKLSVQDVQNILDLRQQGKLLRFASIL